MRDTWEPEILLNDRRPNPSFPHEHADPSSFVRRILLNLLLYSVSQCYTERSIVRPIVSV
ncbi:unnamed protein product [Staurois parvus]|uniref:Ycf15 n=1 Tax=Staurois parvus TaxID=386267 RepID=A0ABN9HM14_9NEOB|nr:unnamed protein product [Staurois parvus]